MDVSCGVRGRDTKKRIVEIAHFTKVTDYYQFTRTGHDFRNKVPVSELEIRIALLISCE